jgi:hypothetical protein
MALSNDSPIKLELQNDLFQHNESHKVEVNFEYEDEESKDGQLSIKGVILTV